MDETKKWYYETIKFNDETKFLIRLNKVSDKDGFALIHFSRIKIASSPEMYEYFALIKYFE